MDPQKFNAVWVQDTTEGDVSDWLKWLGVGMVMRGLAWTAGYGNGTTKVKIAFDGDSCCEEQLVTLPGAGVFSLGSRIKLDCSKQKICDWVGAPLVPPKSLLVSGRLTDVGMEIDLFTLQSEPHSSVKRSISEDGNTMTTECTVCMPGAKEIKVKTTHKKSTEEPAPPCSELLSSCLVPIFTDAIPEDSPYKDSVISDSLAEYFSSAEQCLDSLVTTFKAKEADSSEKEVSLEEVSEANFTIHLTKNDDSKAALVYNLDKDAGTLTSTYRAGETDVVTFTWQVRADPVRLEVSNSWPHDQARLYDSYQWAQRTLKMILPHSKQ